MSRAGAKVIVVDPSADRLAVAREASDAAEQRVEFHHGDPAELPFIRGERIDLAIAIHSLAEVDDLGRVFRQVHRVLRSESPLLVSLPHPLAIVASLESSPTPQMTRTSFDPGPADWATDEDSGKVIPHRIADVFTTLSRSNFRVDTLWEPLSLETYATWHWSPLAEWVPMCFVIRGKKEGI